MNLCDYFLWSYVKDRVYRTKPSHYSGLQEEIEVVADEMTGDMLRDRVDSFVVCLQRVHVVEGSHIEHVFT
jgi:hypothetical protein